MLSARWQIYRAQDRGWPGAAYSGSYDSWLEKKGSPNGFEVLTVTCSSKWMKIPKPNAEFALDCTDFSACIKIIDLEKFNVYLGTGVGSKGRAFGFGMLML